MPVVLRGIDPETGFPWDDTKRHMDDVSPSTPDYGKIFEGNDRRVYPRLNEWLTG
ncbi:MAG TPA: hypothetical protein VG756_01745 [Pseudonocardiaceae bacterium]|nr:hypothetical protein [Pseudonocardiaceae bacterium]